MRLSNKDPLTTVKYYGEYKQMKTLKNILDLAFKKPCGDFDP